MNEEEKKAIDIVKNITEDDLLNYWEGPEEPYNAIQTVLNLIEKQQKELEKKDKIIRKLQIECQKNFDLAMDTEIERIEANQIIDKMAEFISDLCRGIEVVRDNFDIDIRDNYNVTKIQKYDKESIVKDFTNLVEKENK